MEKKKEGAAPQLGPLEIEFEFTPAGGGEPAKVVTTPSQWARADEWIDALSYGGVPHSDGWLADKMLGALQLQAAVDNGLMRRGDITLERIFEMRNRYEIAEVGGGEGTGGEPGANPTGGGAGA